MITVIGSLNMDLVLYTSYFPQVGETISSTRYLEIPGGKGANQAMSIGKLNGSVEMIGAIGNDGFGDKLIQNLSNHGIGIQGIKRCTSTTGTAFINVDDHGDNKIILVPGANYELTTQHIDEEIHLLEKSEFIILQLEVPLTTVFYAIQKAKELNKTVILNPAPACKLDANLLKNVDILTPNETELEILTDTKINTLKDIKYACHKLLAQGIKAVIVTIGAKGAVIVTMNNFISIPGYEVDAIDTTAAGDSFTGALALGLNQGYDLEAATHFANQVASITVQRKGAQISLPTLDEFHTYFK
ncbi:ribokinase [Niameybacter massiliensis]|uniref:ribokinase n=1 Tax=Niameybacter massiliensis TaxID=1658108 RepID=UPI0006B54E8D|nr:ribokinase [Niameybacter massiliensis]